MLKQASVEQVRKQVLPRNNTVISIVMRHYPRGIKKEWSDEFRNLLAPDQELFTEWKARELKVGHNEAFSEVDYENRFELTPVALHLLKMYSEQSKTQDIYLVCQCRVGERCHREMLMLVAHKKYGAEIDQIYHDYAIFEKRIPELKDEIKLW